MITLYIAVSADKKLWIKELLHLNLFHSCKTVVSTGTLH